MEKERITSTTLPLKKKKTLTLIKRLGCIMLFAFCFSMSAQAQNFQIGIDFLTVSPQGEFNENITNNGYGIGGQFLVGLGRSPFFVGADAGIVRYGSEKSRQPLSATIPEIILEVRTDNNIALTHFLFRAQPREGDVRPYVDGLIGFKYLFTRTTISDDFDGESLASTTNFSDFTFSYGIGGGVQIHLADIGSRGQIALDGKVRYLRGFEAEYLRRGSIRRQNGTVIFDVLSSRTDVVTFQIGVTFRL